MTPVLEWELVADLPESPALKYESVVTEIVTRLAPEGTGVQGVLRTQPPPPPKSLSRAESDTGRGNLNFKSRWCIA